jgi:hypothetical protein
MSEFEKAYFSMITESEETALVADKEDTYKNFTGTIDYEGNSAEVTDATFELKDGKIYWKDGIWKDGVWEDGIWKNGTWKAGEWINGLWNNGTWEHGIWNEGIWENGIWKNGFWSFGEWRNGTWKDGTWEGGDWLGGDWQRGRIYDEHANAFMVEYNPPYSSAF